MGGGLIFKPNTVVAEPVFLIFSSTVYFLLFKAYSTFFLHYYSGFAILILRAQNCVAGLKE